MYHLQAVHPHPVALHPSDARGVSPQRVQVREEHHTPACHQDQQTQGPGRDHHHAPRVLAESPSGHSKGSGTSVERPHGRGGRGNSTPAMNTPDVVPGDGTIQVVTPTLLMTNISTQFLLPILTGRLLSCRRRQPDPGKTLAILLPVPLALKAAPAGPASPQIGPYQYQTDGYLAVIGDNQTPAGTLAILLPVPLALETAPAGPTSAQIQAHHHRTTTTRRAPTNKHY